MCEPEPLGALRGGRGRDLERRCEPRGPRKPRPAVGGQIGRAEGCGGGEGERRRGRHGDAGHSGGTGGRRRGPRAAAPGGLGPGPCAGWAARLMTARGASRRLRPMSRLRSQAGQAGAEYMGFLAVVAVIVAALATSGVGGRLAGALHHQVDCIAGGCAVTGAPGERRRRQRRRRWRLGPRSRPPSRLPSRRRPPAGPSPSPPASRSRCRSPRPGPRRPHRGRARPPTCRRPATGRTSRRRAAGASPRRCRPAAAAARGATRTPTATSGSGTRPAARPRTAGRTGTCEHKDGSHTNVNPDGSVRGPDNFPNKPRGSEGGDQANSNARRGRRRGRGRRRARRDHLVGGQAAVAALRPRRPGLRGGAVKSAGDGSGQHHRRARGTDRRPARR